MTMPTRTAADGADGLPGAEVSYGCRVLVVDDQEMVRIGVHALVTAQPWVERCLGAGTFDTGLQVGERFRPHLALVDLFVGQDSGLTFCEALLERSPNTSVLLMSGTGGVSPAVAHAAGACGFVPKDWPARRLLEAMQGVWEGCWTFPRSRGNVPRTLLSRRELDVLGHLVQGLSNVEIGRELHLSHHTVKQHTRALYKKLEVSGRAEAAGRARQLGLVR